MVEPKFTYDSFFSAEILDVPATAGDLASPYRSIYEEMYKLFYIFLIELNFKEIVLLPVCLTYAAPREVQIFQRNFPVIIASV